MSEQARYKELSAGLATFGSDFSRWRPDTAQGAREALLADPTLRRAWEHERALDRTMAAARGELDDQIGRSGAVRRVREAALARTPQSPLGRTDWRRIAAAVLVASVLGGAMDLVLAGRGGEVADVAMVDPVLYGLDAMEIQ
jgi:hypothetical protein